MKINETPDSERAAYQPSLQLEVNVESFEGREPL